MDEKKEKKFEDTELYKNTSPGLWCLLAKTDNPKAKELIKIFSNWNKEEKGFDLLKISSINMSNPNGILIRATAKNSDGTISIKNMFYRNSLQIL